VVDGYFPLLDGLEDELDGIEARIFAPQGVPRVRPSVPPSP
jgi:hypothetical protein